MIDKKSVEHVALLARVKVSEEQKDHLGSQLSKILGYIDKLKELDVSKVSPLRGAHLDQNIFRPDQAVKFSNTDGILNNAPAREGNYFKVPKIIE